MDSPCRHPKKLDYLAKFRYICKNIKTMRRGNSFVLALGVLLLQSCSGSTNNKAETEAVTEGADSIATVVTHDEKEETAPETWRVQYFIDEFGEETDEGYLLNVCEGAFSNSATTNSFLYVKIIVTPEDVRFDMYEYGDFFMKGEGSLEYRVKLPDDTEMRFKTYNYDNGVNAVVKQDVAKVRELFEKYPRLRFAARTLSSYSTSTYRFVYEGNPEEFTAKLKELQTK